MRYTRQRQGDFIVSLLFIKWKVEGQPPSVRDVFLQVANLPSLRYTQEYFFIKFVQNKTITRKFKPEAVSLTFFRFKFSFMYLKF